jgi:uncharacterized membrane protein YoaK (UPF0700 family)
MKSAYQITVTHLTGLFTKTAFSLVDQNYLVAIQAFSIIFSFWLGAFTTGCLCGTSSFKPQPRYGIILIMEGITLLLSVGIFEGENYPNDSARYGFCLVSFATGLQNAMFSTFSGAVIRTSHLTGMLNDSGNFK